jgi:hypothetical protein
MEKQKVVTMRGRRFRFDPMSARDGSWVLNLTLNKKMPLGLDKSLPGLDPNRPDLTEDEFHSVQDKVLGTISELIEVNGAKAARKILDNGRFQVAGIDSDPNLVFTMTRVAFLHTVLPFFDDPESESTGTGE